MSSFCNCVFLVTGIILIFILTDVSCQGKYSKELNDMELRTESKPFRIQKLNVIWNKARKRLSPEKLKMLNTELKLQDKEEITWKRLKAEGQDKDGLKEAELRKKLRAVLNIYDLTDHFEDASQAKEPIQESLNDSLDRSNENNIFKDKKLNKLWIKAERAGFSEEELKTLKEEFQHHQEKVDEYYEFLNAESEKDEMDNSLDSDVNKPSGSPTQELRDKHQELKRNYDKLNKLAVFGPEGKEFEEPRVKELWRLAQKGDFSPEELDSLKEELKHYEHRVKKLMHLQAQVDIAEASNKWVEDKVDDKKRLEHKIKEYSHKVDKIHSHLEGRIMQRHLEL